MQQHFQSNQNLFLIVGDEYAPPSQRGWLMLVWHGYGLHM
jgi:hypothetical protein